MVELVATPKKTSAFSGVAQVKKVGDDLFHGQLEREPNAQRCAKERLRRFSQRNNDSEAITLGRDPGRKGCGRLRLRIGGKNDVATSMRCRHGPRDNQNGNAAGVDGSWALERFDERTGKPAQWLLTREGLSHDVPFAI